MKDKEYTYKVHKKTTWTKKDLIEIGADSNKAEAIRIFRIITNVLGVALFGSMLVFVTAVSVIADAFIEMIPIILIFIVLLILFVVIVMDDYSINCTIKLADDRIYYQRENHGFIKYPCTKIAYNKIHCVYESLECPRELILSLGNHRSVLGKEFMKTWTAFNGKYIVAEDRTGHVLCGLRYNSKAWERLKEKCSDSTLFQTYEERQKYIEKQRRVQEEADKSVKDYDGYVN